MNFGGPSVGFFTTKEKYTRNLPGRIVGQTVDTRGNKVYCLTLATREQHIRRERATSNICTSAGVMTTALAMHLTLLGEEGFRNLAQTNHSKTCQLVKLIESNAPSVKVLNNTFFNEILIQLPKGVSAESFIGSTAKFGVLAGVSLRRLFGASSDNRDMLLVAVTELTTDEDMDRLVEELALIQ